MSQSWEIEFIVPSRPHRYELVLAFEIETLTELSVGGSALDMMLGSGTTENPIAKTVTVVKYCNDKEIAEIVPYIPASTLKGLMRSRAEEIARGEGKHVTLQRLLKELETLNTVFDTQILNEVVDKLISRILKQYIDENLVNMIANRIRGKERFTEFVQALDSVEKLSEFLAGLARDEEKELLANLAHPIHAIIGTYNIYTKTCNPVVEGLVCELPLPKYKLLLLKALAKAAGERLEYPCKVCRLFGLPGYMSRLIVTDAWPIDVKELLILSRTHIAIDRLRGSVVHGKTFDIEYLAPHAKLLFITVYHLATRENLEEKLVGETTNPNNCLEAIRLLKEKIEDPIDKENMELLEKLIQNIKTVQLGKRKTWGMGEAKIECKALRLQDTYTKKQLLEQGKIDLSREKGVPLPLLKLIEIYNLDRISRESA